jgi:hypothetical protein
MGVRGVKKYVFIILILGIVASISILGISTYAKYTSELSSINQKATIAKWSFESDNESHDFTFDMEDTYDQNTLISNRIAPGTRGRLTFFLSNENTETGVDYKIVLSKNNNIPRLLKFYSDSECSNELTSGRILEGNLIPGESEKEIVIYWKWLYETGSNSTEKESNNVVDTSDGASSTTDGMTITATITGTQSQPVAQ